ncbi:hypothetical protein NIES970_27550 (plasmid) [[Synechococcus] sp. NIES-970]|nr:hypothetical protein NIES970_27550 [[Synechococcus] sp. NIES-970]
MSNAARHQLIVCEACVWKSSAAQNSTHPEETSLELKGSDLLAQLQALHETWPYRDHLSFTTTGCLCVCDNPCAIAFVGHQKPSFLFGDLDPRTCAADLLTAAELYVDSEDGMVPLYQLPKALRPHRLARIPPAP